MIIRVKFAKFGLMRYIGHLDVLRSMQKAISRSKIDIAYSKGFHPHMEVTFAAPLSMAVTSDGEYMDLEMNSEIDPGELLKILNAQMPEGFCLISAKRLPDYVENTKKETAMSSVALADYEIAFRADKFSAAELEEIKAVIEKLFGAPSFEIVKERKAGEEIIDIHNDILDYGFSYEEFAASEKVIHAENNPLVHRNSAEDDLKLYVRVSCGSKMNIRPDDLYGKILRECGFADREYPMRIHRMEMYTDKDGYRPLNY